MVLSSETLLIRLIKQNIIVQNNASRQFIETLLMEVGVAFTRKKKVFCYFSITAIFGVKTLLKVVLCIKRLIKIR